MSQHEAGASNYRSTAPISTTSFAEHHDFFCAMVRGGLRYAYNPEPVDVSDWIASAASQASPRSPSRAASQASPRRPSRAASQASHHGPSRAASQASHHSPSRAASQASHHSPRRAASQALHRPPSASVDSDQSSLTASVYTDQQSLASHSPAAVPLVPAVPAEPLVPAVPAEPLVPAVPNDDLTAELRRLHEAATRRLQQSMNYAETLEHALHDLRAQMVPGSVPPPLRRPARPDDFAHAMPPPFSRAHLSPTPVIAELQQGLDYVMNLLQISERNNNRLLEDIIQVSDAIASGATAHVLSHVSLGALIGPHSPHASLIALTHSSQHSPAAVVMQAPNSNQASPAGSVVQAPNSNQASPAGSVVQGSISNHASPAGSVVQAPNSNRPSPAGSVISLSHNPENSRAASATSSSSMNPSQISNRWNSAISYDPAELLFASSMHSSGNLDDRSSAISYDPADLSFASSMHNSGNLDDRSSAVSFDPDQVSLTSQRSGSVSAPSIGTTTLHTPAAPTQSHPHHHLLALARSAYDRAVASTDRTQAFAAAAGSGASASGSSVGFDPAEQLPVSGRESQRAAVWQATSNRIRPFAAAAGSGASAFRT